MIRSKRSSGGPPERQPNHQPWYAKRGMHSCNTYTLHTRFCTFGADLYAQSVLINEISASELRRKFIKSALCWLGRMIAESEIGYTGTVYRQTRNCTAPQIPGSRKGLEGNSIKVKCGLCIKQLFSPGGDDRKNVQRAEKHPEMVSSAHLRQHVDMSVRVSFKNLLFHPNCRIIDSLPQAMARRAFQLSPLLLCVVWCYRVTHLPSCHCLFSCREVLLGILLLVLLTSLLAAADSLAL